LLKSRRRWWWWVDILVVLPVVVPVVVVVVAVPCVGHLKYYVDEIKITQENDSKGIGIGIDP
jgi:type IV secretory pathway component VirB8